jgi:hypothetical protein
MADPSTRRRAFLSTLGTTALGATATVGLAGCLDRGQSGVPVPETDATTTEPNETTPETTTEGKTTTDTTETTTDEQPSDFVRCRGDPVSVERTVTDEPGYDEDDMEYFSENETIRYVAARSGDEPALFETISFDEWASIECAEAALERVREVTTDRLGTDEFGSGMGVPPDVAETEDLVVRLHVATHVEDGETVKTPTLSRDELAAVAPRTVEATVSLEGEEFSRTVPVFAQHVEIGLA